LDAGSFQNFEELFRSALQPDPAEQSRQIFSKVGDQSFTDITDSIRNKKSNKSQREDNPQVVSEKLNAYESLNASVLSMDQCVILSVNQNALPANHDASALQTFTSGQPESATTDASTYPTQVRSQIPPFPASITETSSLQPSDTNTVIEAFSLTLTQRTPPHQTEAAVASSDHTTALQGNPAATADSRLRVAPSLPSQILDGIAAATSQRDRPIASTQIPTGGPFTIEPSTIQHVGRPVEVPPSAAQPSATQPAEIQPVAIQPNPSANPEEHDLGSETATTDSPQPRLMHLSSTQEAAQQDASDSSSSGSGDQTGSAKSRDKFADAAMTLANSNPINHAAITTTPPQDTSRGDVKETSNAGATSRVVPTADAQETKTNIPVKELTLHLQGQSGETLSVRVLDQGTRVQVAVRTSDSSLASSLRQDLPSLTGSLDRIGWKSDSIVSSPTVAAPSLPDKPPGTNDQQNGSGHHPLEWDQPQHQGKKHSTAELWDEMLIRQSS
jgi:hypothetical protein